MTLDNYAGASRGWATGAELVYQPIAREMVAMSRHPLDGRLVLDAGAGTGAATAALRAAGAQVVATDLSLGMLGWNAGGRPPCAVADVRALPLQRGAVDDTVAAFVLNHLSDPEAGFSELIRVTRPGGALLASVYGNASRSVVRDRIDTVAQAAGWRPPRWYLEAKATAVPLLGSAGAMAAAARTAGLAEVAVEERPVDVGITEPEQLVAYRFGHATYAAWLSEIGPDRGAAVRHEAVAAIRPIMEPYRPIVVFLSSVVP